MIYWGEMTQFFRILNNRSVRTTFDQFPTLKLMPSDGLNVLTRNFSKHSSANLSSFYKRKDGADKQLLGTEVLKTCEVLPGKCWDRWHGPLSYSQGPICRLGSCWWDLWVCQETLECSLRRFKRGVEMNRSAWHCVSIWYVVYVTCLRKTVVTSCKWPNGIFCSCFK